MRKHMHTEWPVEVYQSHKRLYAYSMHTLVVLEGDPQSSHMHYMYEPRLNNGQKRKAH